ncbi:MAG: relaxase/mobilization nuclease domain-containing protein [Methyloligellaceae bacterium]
MILKASQRGGGKQLALHLMRTDDNDHVEVHQIRGFVSDNLLEALKEAYGASQETRCKQFLFSVSLNPPETENVPISVFEDTIEKIEQKNDLSGQPRVVVFHEKEGRRHAHAVWSRIDEETGTARNLSHFKLKLRDISRETYLEQGWKMPKGLMNSKDKDPRNFTLAEWQQAKRMGHHAKDLKAMMQECWAVSDSRAAFASVLRERGISLAKGDRNGFVGVTHDGHIFSVPRYVGKHKSEVHAKIGEPENLPNVEEVKAKTSQDMSLTFKRHVREAHALKQQDLRVLNQKKEQMVFQQREQRTQLKTYQLERWNREIIARQERFNKGFRGLWDRLSGKHSEIRKQNEQDMLISKRRDLDECQRLIQAQIANRQTLQTEYRSIRKHHADLLLNLKQDYSRIQENLRPEKVQDAPKPRRKNKLDNLREQPVRQTFQEKVQPEKQPTQQDRLERLRSGRPSRGTGRTRGRDRER